MLVAPNANGLLVAPPGVFSATFSQTTTAMGAHSQDPYSQVSRSKRLAWDKTPVPIGTVTGIPSCTGYLRVESHPIISRNRTTETMNATPIQTGSTTEVCNVAQRCLEEPLPVLGDFGVADGADYGGYVGGNRLVASIGDLVMLVGHGPQVEKNNSLKIRLLDQQTWVMKNELVVPLKTGGVPFSNTLVSCTGEVVFVPGEQDHFGIYDPLSNTFRFSRQNIRQVLIQAGFELPADLGFLYDQGIELPDSNLMVFPGLFSGVSTEGIRPAITYDVKGDTISYLPSLDATGGPTSSYTNPEIAGNFVVFTSGTSDCLIFSFWDLRTPNVDPVSYRCSSKLRENRNTFLASSLTSEGLIWYSPYYATTQPEGVQHLIWTVLDPISMELSQTIQVDPMSCGCGEPGPQPSPVSIIPDCDDSVAALVPGRYPPWIVRLSTTSRLATSVRLDLPPCVGLSSTTKVITTQDSLVVPGASIIAFEDETEVNTGVNFYLTLYDTLPAESVKGQKVVQVPLATDKVVYSNLDRIDGFTSYKGVVSTAERSRRVKILPDDNGSECTHGAIESYALQSRVIKEDNTDWRTLQLRQPPFNRAIDPRSYMLS